jgi:hypothetical protein
LGRIRLGKECSNGAVACPEEVVKRLPMERTLSHQAAGAAAWTGANRGGGHGRVGSQARADTASSPGRTDESQALEGSCL